MSLVRFIDVFFRFYIFVRGSLGRNCARVWRCAVELAKSKSECCSPFVGEPCSPDSLLSGESIARNLLLSRQAWGRKMVGNVWTVLVN